MIILMWLFQALVDQIYGTACQYTVFKSLSSRISLEALTSKSGAMKGVFHNDQNTQHPWKAGVIFYFVLKHTIMYIPSASSL